MPRFLIEVVHESEVVACARVVEVFLRTGSHYLTHADGGCKDGVHKSWIIVEAILPMTTSRSASSFSRFARRIASICSGGISCERLQLPK